MVLVLSIRLPNHFPAISRFKVYIDFFSDEDGCVLGGQQTDRDGMQHGMTA